MTWQCTFTDGGPALEDEADSVVNPSQYIVKTRWRGRAEHGPLARPFFLRLIPAGFPALTLTRVDGALAQWAI